MTGNSVCGAHPCEVLKRWVQTMVEVEPELANIEKPTLLRTTTLGIVKQALAEYDASLCALKHAETALKQAITPEQKMRAKADRDACRSCHTRTGHGLTLFVHQLPREHAKRICKALALEWPPKSDEATLWLRCKGRPKMIRLCKGMRPESLWTLLGFRPQRREIARITIPRYIRGLTDQYKLSCRYWEIIECGRKALMVGTFVFLQPGTLSQLIFGLVTCVLFAVLCMWRGPALALHRMPCPHVLGAAPLLTWASRGLRTDGNSAPYDKEVNSTLQQVCQLTVFLSLLVALILRLQGFQDSELVLSIDFLGASAADTGGNQTDGSGSALEDSQQWVKELAAWLLIMLTLTSPAVAVVMLFHELCPNLSRRIESEAKAAMLHFPERVGGAMQKLWGAMQEQCRGICMRTHAQALAQEIMHKKSYMSGHTGADEQRIRTRSYRRSSVGRRLSIREQHMHGRTDRKPADGSCVTMQSETVQTERI